MIAQTLLQDWLYQLTHHKRLSPNTVEAYGTDLRGFFDFIRIHKGEEPTLAILLSLTTGDFRSWLSHRLESGFTHRSTARALSAVRTFYKYLEQKNHGQNKYLSTIRPPRVQIGLPRPLTPAQAKGIIDEMGALSDEPWIGARNQAFFLMLYGCGLRIGEALSLNQEDAPVHGILKVMGKGRKERMVPVLPVLQAAIQEYKRLCPYHVQPKDPLFLGVQGKRLNATVAQKIMRDQRRLSGLPETATPHALRHSCATHLMTESNDLRSIQELLGHASLSSTQVYTQLDHEKLLRVYDQAHPRAKGAGKKET